MSASFQHIKKKIDDNVKMHVVVASNSNSLLTKEKIKTGRYSFSELDSGFPKFVGNIFSDKDGEKKTKGSIRYGDCLAIPDDKGDIYFVYLGVHSGSYHHLIVGKLNEHSADSELVRSELKRMWNHKHVDMEPLESFILISSLCSRGPKIDCNYYEAREIVGRINKWFDSCTDPKKKGNVRTGDYIETRIKKGRDRSKRLRVEATTNGFAAYTGDKQNEEGNILEWRLIWCSHSLEDCLDYAVESTDKRERFVEDLVVRAKDLNGVMRYFNGGMYGAFYKDSSTFFVKCWSVFEIRDDLEGVIFDPSLDLRKALSV